MSDIINPSPETSPYAYDGLLTRRVMAFIIDYMIILLLMIPAAVIVFVLGIATLGLAFYLFPILFFIVAGLYFGLSLSGPFQASLGMRTMDVRMIRDDGGPIDFATAILHLVTFWILNSLLTPFILLVGLFTDRKRLLHDILIGTTTIRASRMGVARY
ncbi:RDD family protein [Rhizobium alvei]|uniref:RDD family protein n=1 Tax=Rhizobium alvei TaxID=1132659 RepID=A0ABT8YKC8_9HYPH|nr:RDD family protein [Rhizobium alvei]MDO6963759.1 RDD family protein [Rhizobium alvei]